MKYFLNKKPSNIVNFAVLMALCLSSVIFVASRGLDTPSNNKQLHSEDSPFQFVDVDSTLRYSALSAEESSDQFMGLLSSQISEANALLQKGEYLKAKEVLIRTTMGSAFSGNARYDEKGMIYIQLAYCYLAQEEFDSAQIFINKSIRLIEKNGGAVHEKVASAYYVRGLIMKAKGDYETAVTDFLLALQIRRQLNDASSSSEANIMTMLGGVYDDMNEFDRAIEWYVKAEKKLSEAGKEVSTEAASCYLNMMSSYNNKGNYRAALEYGNKVIEAYSSLSLTNHANVASAYAKFGEIYSNLGDYGKAEEYFSRALLMFEAHHGHKQSAIGTLYQRLGGIYARTAEPAKAIEYSLKGTLLYEQVFGDVHPQTGIMYEQLADVFAEAKQYRNAITYYHKALSARQRVRSSESRNDIASLYATVAGVYLRQRLIDSALANLKIAVRMEKASIEKNVLLQSKIRRLFGDLSFEQKKYSNAVQEYQDAIVLLTGNSDNADGMSLPDISGNLYQREMLDAVMAKAAALENQYKLKKNVSSANAALLHYVRGIELMDKLRHQYISDASKYYLAETGSAAYRGAVRIALALHSVTSESRYLEQAFLISDRSKGNILLNRLFDNEAKQYSGIHDSLLSIEHELLSRIAQYETQLIKVREKKNGFGADSHRNIQKDYFDAKQQHEELIRLFERNYPKYYELKYAGYDLTVQELQNTLEKNELIVEYMIDGSEVYLFGVSKNTMSVKTLKGSEGIQQTAKKFTAALKTYSSELYAKTGYELYSSLLKPIAPMVNAAEKITVIPDGFLFYIPFEALPVKKLAGAAVDFTTIEYVISGHDVSYSYSAAFDMTISGHRRHSSSASSFLGFAPVFKDSVNNGNFLANRSYIEQSGLSDVRSITLDGKTFNELKYSEVELESIGSTLQGRSIDTKLFLFEGATEKNFKLYSPEYDIVHIATHGFINETNPKLSAVLFSQPSGENEDDDGILHVSETFNLNLKAELVVLSSCESGIGKLVDGEGMMALSRGLFYAGAKNIVFSLWKVSDRQTYLLMDEFYKHIADGKSFTSSLRSAKRSMIASKETAFPGKWSGFVLVGQ